MRASEIEAIIRKVPQLEKYFVGISTIDTIPNLEEEHFTIINTEYIK